MKDINIVIDSQTHKVQFPDNFLGLNAENLQGNINFTFTNGFVNGIARLELSIDCESGFIPNLQNTGDSYTLPILSSLLTSDNIVMQLVIEQTDLITYKLTTDTSINNQKTYYTRSGVEGEYVYTIVENPKVADIGTYYEAQIPIFKTHIFNMTVGESINAVNTIPDDYPTWIDTLNSLVGQVNAKIIEMNQALAEVDNLDITATKEGTTVTITITRKDGSQQIVTITDGKDGVGIVKIEKTGTNLLVDTYTIYYTDDSTSTFQVKNGRGIVSIDKTDTNILTDTYTITYNDNTTSTFYVVNGNGVESIVKIGTSGLIDTYRISYTNGEYYDYQVANGNGIDNIQKTDTTGLVDTYTITYTNGTTSTYIITNGNGISNIAKTSTVDNVDTYTIYYTNGTTSTFTVTNSTVTNQEFQELQRLVDYNALYANALIKMNNSGTDLTINDTAEAPMPMSLAPSELEQETNIITYTCIGTETGDYYFTYNSINYQFTMPTISAGSVLAFNTTTLELYLGTTQITTTTDNTGTLITMSTTPNPNYPQDIHTISGDNTIVICNANLFNKNTVVEGYIQADGIISSNAGYYTSDFIPIKPNTSYYKTKTGTPRSKYYDKNKQLLNTTSYQDISIGANEGTFTTPENAYYMRLSTRDTTILVDDVMVNIGTSALPFVEHQEQSLTLNLPVENLFNINNGTNYNIDNGSISIVDNKVRATNLGIGTGHRGGMYLGGDELLGKTITLSAKWDASHSDIGKINIVTSNNSGGDRTTLGILETNGGSLTLTLPNSYTTGTQFTISFYTNNSSRSAGVYVDYFDIQVELGTKANSYTPYGTPALEYCKIGDYEDEFVIPDNQLFDNTTITSGQFVNQYGTMGTDATAFVSDYIEITPNTDYYISGRTTWNSVGLYDSSKTFIERPNYTATGILNITNTNVKYIRINASLSDINTLMLNKGSTALPYEPYNPNGKWYLKKNVGKELITTFNSKSGTTANNMFNTNVISNILKPSDGTKVSNMMSNCFISKAPNTLYTNDTLGIGINTSGTICCAFGLNSQINTVELANQWLNSNELIAYIPLATPEYILLNDTLQSQLTEIYKWVKAYQEQTSITQINNDLPFIINTITCYDLNKLLTRVEVLESEV